MGQRKKLNLDLRIRTTRETFKKHYYVTREEAIEEIETIFRKYS